MRLLTTTCVIIALLCLAAGAAILLRPPGPSPRAEETRSAEAAVEATEREEANSDLDTPAANDNGDNRFIAYYFHWTTRCQTCLEIEEMSREAISREFEDELRDGGLRWQAHNMELPQYAHFLEDFDLSMPSLVLVHERNREVVEFKVLAATWDLVAEPWNLEAYVVEETRQFLSASPAKEIGETDSG